MKTYTEFSEGIFSRKSPEEKKLEKMRDEIRQMASKMAGRGGWSEGEQKKYNKTWIEYRKLNDGKPPRGPKPGVYWDKQKMSSYQHDDAEKELHKKLGIKD